MSVWRSHLLRIGDRCPEYGLGNVDFKEHIDACCSVVFRELEHSGEDILKFLLQCAEQLPHKIPLYGVVIGLINLENEDFVKRILEITQINLQDAISSEKCDQIRVLIRFLAALMCSKVISPGSLVNLFETLLSSACTIVDEEKGNPSWQPRADFYVFCILSSLPWGGAELNEQIPEMIEEVMVGIQSYLSIRKHVHDTGVTFFEIGEGNDKTLDEKDFLEDLWVRVQSMSNDGWKVDSVPRPHLTFEAQLVGGISHGIGPIICNEPPVFPSLGVDDGKQKHEAELRYPQRLRRLNIFPSSKSENMQPMDRFVVEEYLLDVLLFFNGCRKECALYMASLPVPFRYEYLMAETIFSQLLLLPRAPFKPIYYTLVIIDLCKALPGAFPAVVAGAVRALFDRIADLDMECRTRLILWFSHHLANFQFTWPWEEWAYVIDLPKWAPKRVFVQEVLEREVRLSYWEKIKQSIENAVGLDELLPLKGGSNFKYRAEDGQESSPQHALSKDLNSMVKGKVIVHEIVLWVEEKVVAVHGFKCALEVVIQTLLDIGSKSFTHLITVMERYGNVIAKMCPDQEKQVMLIDEVSSYWKDNTQMTAIAIDRMMGYRLVSNLAIVYWVFLPSSMQQFHTSDRPWEILRNAISKTYNRISDLRKEIYSLKRSVLAAKESLVEAEAELEAAESKLSIVNGEPVRGENPGRLKRLKAFADKRKEEEVSTRESVEAKEALLARALEENKALFITMYKSFANVLKEGLSHADVDGKQDNVPSRNADAMAVDPDEPLTMEVDEENERSKKIESQNGYTIEEAAQWRRSTLAYVKAFTRQYASEIWPHINELDSDVFSQDVDPQFQNAVNTGLGKPTPQS